MLLSTQQIFILDKLLKSVNPTKVEPGCRFIIELIAVLMRFATFQVAYLWAFLLKNVVLLDLDGFGNHAKED
jgi:hypothetical protein